MGCGRDTPDFTAERLKWHKDCSLAVIITGDSSGTSWWPRGPGAAGLGVVRSTGKSQGTVLVSAFLLLPEPRATPAGLWLVVSHLVPFPRLWSLSLQDGTYPGNRGGG